MALIEVKWWSAALQKQTAATVIVPQKAGPHSVLYLLHGLSDDHSAWQRRSRVELYVADLPLIVVMPDGGRGFYCDAHVGQKYESALISDLIPFIDETFNTRAERSGRCIGGLSMGGYGAAKLALKFPELFVSAHSHSGALGFGHENFPKDRPMDDAFLIELERIAGPNPQGGENDCHALAEEALKIEQRPALRIDCGTEDYLLESNRNFHAHLKNIGYAHEYEEFSGAHNWDYWDLHIRGAIKFHARHLGL